MDAPLIQLAAEKKSPTASGISRRGFAAMDQARRQAIARKGGIAAQAKGTAHKFTTEEAREAGHKGGKVTQAKEKAHEEPRPRVMHSALGELSCSAGFSADENVPDGNPVHGFNTCDLAAVAELAEKVGGVEKLRRMLELVEEIRTYPA